jgi:hypothetical protein
MYRRRPTQVSLRLYIAPEGHDATHEGFKAAGIRTYPVHVPGAPRDGR